MDGARSPRSGAPVVSVVVPARDAARTLPRTLAALAAQDLEDPFEVLVVDDGSRDGTAELAERSSVVARVLRLAGAGPAAARNAGARAARAPALAFTDADCVPAPGWLSAGLAGLASADLVQGRVEPDPGAPRSPFERTLSVTAAWGLFESANLFVRRELFERLGGFPPGIAAPAERLGGVELRAKDLAEDVFFGWAARRAGARTTFSGAALVHHAVFERSAREFIAERKRLRHFPRIAREAPELRGTFFHRRLFLSRQSAAFDAALAGALAAAAARSPLPLLAAVPYALRVRRTVRHWPQLPAARLAGTTLAADAVGFWALVRGSLTARSPLL